jgi:hypothetical protein
VASNETVLQYCFCSYAHVKSTCSYIYTFPQLRFSDEAKDALLPFNKAVDPDSLNPDPAFQVNPDPATDQDLIRIQGFDDQKLKI